MPASPSGAIEFSLGWLGVTHSEAESWLGARGPVIPVPGLQYSTVTPPKNFV